MAKLKAFTMPKWGIEMSEGTIAEWMVAENQPFAKGTVLTLIETDKITNEVEAEADGRFVRLIAEAGQTYPVGALLAVLSDGGEADPAEIDALVAGFKAVDASFAVDGDDAPGAAPPATPEPAGRPAPATIPDGVSISPVAREKAVAAGLDVAGLEGSGRGGRITAQDVDRAISPPAAPALVGVLPATPASSVFATPMARRVAAIHAVALDGVTGSGPRGRVRKADVLAAIPAPAPAVVSTPAPPPVPTAVPASVASGEVEVTSMSSMRRTIARRLPSPHAESGRWHRGWS